MDRLWIYEEQVFLEDNYELMKYKAIAKKLNRSYGSVARKLENLKLTKRNYRKWTDVENLYLINHYSDVSPIKMVAYLNRSYGSITTRASSLGLKVGYRYLKPCYDEDFFSVDNWCKELAWVSGIVLSDGHVSRSKEHYGTVFVRIKMCDEDVIEKIKTLTNHTGNIVVHEPSNEKFKTSYTINFHGKQVWDFFTDLGFDNNKSHTAKFPNSIPIEYTSHFIRGIFDGDGSITIGKNMYPSGRIFGTKDIVDSVASIVNLHYTEHKTKSIFIIQYTGVRALNFFEYMYKDSNENIRMNRKYDKYLKVKVYKVGL